MTPGILPGAIVIALPLRPHSGNIVIAHQNGREVLKRVTMVEDNRYFLQGDNMQHSTDSRHYGSVRRDDIQSVVIMKLPFTLPLDKQNTLLYVCAAIATILALLQLFRIDLWIEMFEALRIMPGKTSSTLVASGLLLSEVFGLAYLLRLPLSRLATVLSAGLALLAPWAWLVISIWQLGRVGSTGQFGAYVSTPGAMWLVFLNVAWLGLVLFAVYQSRVFAGPQLRKV